MNNYILEYYQGIKDGSITVSKWVALVVDIVVKGYLPSDIDNNIFYEIKENNYAVLYPNSTAKFITALLNAGSSVP